MPTYLYKAATNTGLIVKNRVEANSKQMLIRTLKDNDLMPITIEQVSYSVKKKKPEINGEYFTRTQSVRHSGGLCPLWEVIYL